MLVNMGGFDLESVLGVEECVRYYPPDLAIADDPGAIFAENSAVPEAREVDLFVDVPFCKTICGFCPFNVYPYDAEKVARYLAALENEIAEIKTRHDFSKHRIRTVWVGGGTPSVMSEGVLDRLLALLRANFDLTNLAEFTVEIKPSIADLTDSKIAVLHEHGVGRISMGVQSTDAHQLKVLGRGHTAADAHRVVRLIKDAGFLVNIDMMYRLPGQQTQQMLSDFDAVNTWGLDHISWFPYVAHEGTRLADRIERGRVEQQAGRAEYLTMFEALSSRMADVGFDQYTPYHFGFTGRCEYHVDRWQMPQRDTLGIGPGAFSFFNGWIYTNQHDPAKYESALADKQPPTMMAKRLTEIELITRLAVLGIKFFGLDADVFGQRTGRSLHDYYETEFDLLERLGLIEIGEHGITCTPAGRAFNNDVAAVLGTDAARRTKHPQAIDLMRITT
jgi:oxygen-independent coproporphyrinogen III oxidase